MENPSTFYKFVTTHQRYFDAIHKDRSISQFDNEKSFDDLIRANLVYFTEHVLVDERFMNTLADMNIYFKHIKDTILVMATKYQKATKLVDLSSSAEHYVYVLIAMICTGQIEQVKRIDRNNIGICEIYNEYMNL